MSIERLRTLDPSVPRFGVIHGLLAIPLERSTIEGRTGVKFSAGVDDLGPFWHTVCQFDDGLVVGLLDRAEALHPFVDLYVDERTDHPDGWNAVARHILAVLELEDVPGVVLTDD